MGGILPDETPWDALKRFFEGHGHIDIQFRDHEDRRKSPSQAVFDSWRHYVPLLLVKGGGGSGKTTACIRVFSDIIEGKAPFQGHWLRDSTHANPIQSPRLAAWIDRFEGEPWREIVQCADDPQSWLRYTPSTVFFIDLDRASGRACREAHVETLHRLATTHGRSLDRPNGHLFVAMCRSETLNLRSERRYFDDLLAHVWETASPTQAQLNQYLSNVLACGEETAESRLHHFFDQGLICDTPLHVFLLGKYLSGQAFKCQQADSISINALYDSFVEEILDHAQEGKYRIDDTRRSLIRKLSQRMAVAMLEQSSYQIEDDVLEEIMDDAGSAVPFNTEEVSLLRAKRLEVKEALFRHGSWLVRYTDVYEFKHDSFRLYFATMGLRRPIRNQSKHSWARQWWNRFPGSPDELSTLLTFLVHAIDGLHCQALIRVLLAQRGKHRTPAVKAALHLASRKQDLPETLILRLVRVIVRSLKWTRLPAGEKQLDDMLSLGKRAWPWLAVVYCERGPLIIEYPEEHRSSRFSPPVHRFSAICWGSRHVTGIELSRKRPPELVLTGRLSLAPLMVKRYARLCEQAEIRLHGSPRRDTDSGVSPPIPGTLLTEKESQELIREFKRSQQSIRRKGLTGTSELEDYRPPPGEETINRLANVDDRLVRRAFAHLQFWIHRHPDRNARRTAISVVPRLFPRLKTLRSNTSGRQIAFLVGGLNDDSAELRKATQDAIVACGDDQTLDHLRAVRRWGPSKELVTAIHRLRQKLDGARLPEIEPDGRSGDSPRSRRAQIDWQTPEAVK